MAQPRSKIQITFAESSEPSPMEPETALPGPWWAWAVLLVLIAAVPFASALPGAFLPQDDVNVSENLFLRAWAGLWGVWRFAYNLPQVSPLGYSLLMIEHRIWGHLARHAAGGYHLVSLLLHAANALLLWTLLRKIALPGAFVAAAIFAAHPVQVQSVAWISQQPSLLGTMLALMSLIVYLRFCGVNPPPYEPGPLRLPQSHWMLYAIALVLFILAILAKPFTAALPLVILVIIWWERGRLGAGDLLPLIPMLVISLLTLIGGVVVFRHRPDIADQHISFVQRILISGPAVFFYLYELIRPGTHSFVYTRWNPTAWWNAGALAVVASVIVALWIVRGRIGRAPFACVAIFLILLLPQILFLDVAQQRDAFVADSVMYTPAIALIVPLCALIAAWLAPHGGEITASSATTWIASAVVLAALVLSFGLTQNYRSADRLWADAIQRNPKSVYALNQLGVLELSRKMTTPAFVHLSRALELDRDNPVTHVNLGNYYETEKEFDRAYAQYAAAIKLRPDDLDARCGLARILALQGNTDAALDQYHQVLDLRPDYDKAMNDIAMLYADRGQYKEALDCYHRGIRASPRFLPLHINLASLCYSLGDFEGAFKEVTIAAELDPDDYTIRLNYGAICGHIATLVTDPAEKKAWLGRSEDALRYAIYLNTDSAIAAHNLAIALSRQADLNPAANAGKRQEAVFYFAKACQLDPGNAEFRLHLQIARHQAARAPS